MTFETGTFTWTNFDGGNTTVINNPQSGGINTSTKVGQTIKGPGGQPWGGGWIQLAGPIDFSTLKYFRMKVFSKAPGTKVLLKVENETTPGQSFEMEATTTLTNAWEDLSFNYSAVNMAFSYHKIVIIFQNGTVGDGSANFTFLFDDIRQEAAPAGALTAPKLPLTFDAAGVDKKFVDFDGGATAVILNPYKTGINTSDTVARMVKNAGAVWAGSKMLLGETLDFTTKKLFKMKVYSPRIGAKILLKVEGAVPTWEKEATTTKANEWEELSFDYTGVSTSLSYNQLVFILDLGTAGDGSANYTILFDDIRLEAGSPGPTVPTIAAPTPPARVAGDVISVFSNAYTDITGVNFNPGWGQSTVYSEVMIAGNATKKYTNASYQGFEIAPAMNLTSMTKLHFDIWSPDCTEFKFFLISPSPTTEAAVTVTPTLSGWKSVDVDLSGFSPVVLSNVFQMKFEAKPTTACTVYLDNIYFYKAAVVPTAPTTAAPTPPARNAGNVISVFSNAYTDITGVNFNQGWGQTTVYSEVLIAGNHPKKNATLN